MRPSQIALRSLVRLARARAKMTGLPSQSSLRSSVLVCSSAAALLHNLTTTIPLSLPSSHTDQKMSPVVPELRVADDRRSLSSGGGEDAASIQSKPDEAQHQEVKLSNEPTEEERKEERRLVRRLDACIVTWAFLGESAVVGNRGKRQWRRRSAGGLRVVLTDPFCVAMFSVRDEGTSPLGNLCREIRAKWGEA
jgi:hypothetical protein